jgi:hypothetical protein
MGQGRHSSGRARRESTEGLWSSAQLRAVTLVIIDGKLAKTPILCGNLFWKQYRKNNEKSNLI